MKPPLGVGSRSSSRRRQPAKIANRGSPSAAWDRTIEAVRRVGRRQWKKESGHLRQARVEDAFFRYESNVGGVLRARREGGQVAETVIPCNVQNQMTALGRSESCAIAQ